MPLELRMPGQTQPVRRTFSLSNAPNRARYRISVKRESHGLASSYLHDGVDVGSVVNAGLPAGDIVLDCKSGPVVLISAGIGMTPMLSMLETLADVENGRPVWFIHGARNAQHHALAQEVRDAAARRSDIHTHIAYGQPGPEDRAELDYDSAGRVDEALIRRLISHELAEYYVCGPVRFMTDIQGDLAVSGVAADRVHTESFGPGSGDGHRQ